MDLLNNAGFWQHVSVSRLTGVSAKETRLISTRRLAACLPAYRWIATRMAFAQPVRQRQNGVECRWSASIQSRTASARRSDNC